MNLAVRNNLFLVGGFSLIAILFTLPIYEHPGYWGIQDWDWCLFYDGLTRESIIKYLQMPLWNPFIKGGIPLLANPESNIFSPALLVQLFAGELWAAKLNITVHVIIGLCGSYVLGRYYRLSFLGAFLVAIIFMMNSMFSSVLTAGMEWGNSIAFIPWVFYFYLKSGDKFIHTLGAAFVLTLMWLGGGVYPFTISVLLLGTHALIAVISGVLPLKKAFGLLATIYGLTFAFGAVKFIPSIEFTLQFTRHSDLYAGLSLESFCYGLLGRDQSLAAILGKSRESGLFRGFSQNMDEVGMYVGVLPLVLFVYGAFKSFRKNLAILICLVIFLWLSTGDRSSPLNLWGLVRAIPFFGIMRSIERFRFVVILFVALLAGVGLEHITEQVMRKSGKKSLTNVLSFICVAMVFLDLLWVNGQVFKDAFVIPPISVPGNSTFVQIGGFPEYGQNGPRLDGSRDLHTSFGAAYPAWLASAGSVYGYESMPLPEVVGIKDASDYRGEVFLEGTTGSASYTFWSPNRLEIAVRAGGEGMVVINQNYYSGWRATGAPVRELRGLLAVPVDPGTTSVILVYRPLSFVLGALISILSLLVTGGWCWYRFCWPVARLGLQKIETVS